MILTRINSWVLTTLFCCACTISYSQGLRRYPFQVYSTNIGLSQSSIYHILKDKDGYIWIGTGDGLNQLTPTSVNVFKRDFRDSTGLYSNEIRGLIEGPNGNIWIGTDLGLNTFDRSKKKIQRKYKPVKVCSELTIPIGIYKGQILAMQQCYGILCLDPLTGKVDREYPFGKLFHTDAHFFTTEDDFLWTVTYDDKLVKLNLQTGIFSFISLRDSIGFKHFAQAGPIVANELYIAADSALYTLNIKTDKWHKIRIFDSSILVFGMVNSDQIWVSLLGKGVCRINRSGELLEPTVSELITSDRESINLRNVTTINQTDDSLVWLGVEGTGAISILPESKFQWISKNDPYLPGLTNTFCRSIGVLNSNELILGTYLGGLSHVDLKEKRTEPISYPAEAGNDITSILPWSEDTLILSSETGVWILTGKPPYKLQNAKRLSTLDTKHLTRMDDALILATSQGLYATDPKSDQEINQIAPGYFIYAFAAKKKLWTASNAGIAVFDYALQKIASGGQSLFEYGIKSLYVSRNDHIWLSTQNGLLEIAPTTFALLNQYSTREGLPDNTVYGVVSDGVLLWGSTNRGLFSLDRKTRGINTFTQRDGLQAMEFNTGCFAHLGDKLLVFGGINGINIFDPLTLSQKPDIVHVVLKKISINDRETDPTQRMNSLTSSDRNFIFEWDVLQWTNPGKNRLECKLVGQDTGWTDVDNRNLIRYNALPPGDFTLFTRISTRDGRHGEEKISMVFRISPPFYFTGWFISAASLAFLLLLSALIYRRAAHKFQKRLAVLERQKEMDDLRKRISRDIHDDVGSDLSKMRMLLQQTVSTPTKSKAHYSKLQKLSEHALTGLSEVVWTINSEYDHLPEMVAWFRTYAYDFFESEAIKVRFDCPEQISLFLIEPDLRRNILMIYKEGMNNILKHACATEVSILFACSAEGEFRFSWSDNGKGFRSEKESSGNGLKNMLRRAEASGLEYSLHSTPAAGTTVSIKGNLTQKYYESGS